jgi:transcriptional regulator with XRE-family HTH domain
MAESKEREEARRRRAAYGTPIKELARELGVSVSSVSLWTRDIELTAEQIQRNVANGRAKSVATWTRRHQSRRASFQDEGRERARQHDPLHMAGCMLYWAEGSKERNRVRLTNSDPNMLRFFRDFLVTCFEVDPRRFTLSLNVYLGNGLSIGEIEDWWTDKLAIPRSCVRGHSIDCRPTSSSGKKKNKLPYGVGALYLHDTRIVQHIFGAIQEYGGFEEPLWLDGPPRKPRRRGNTAGG